MHLFENNAYIILWQNNRKLGAIPRTQDHDTKLRDLYYLRQIRDDIYGNIHYEVTGNKRR